MTDRNIKARVYQRDSATVSMTSAQAILDKPVVWLRKFVSRSDACWQFRSMWFLHA